MSQHLNERQETILKLIIDAYIETPDPVGSKTLADSYALDVSPATIRNEMAALEQRGFIRQPYTSAGRIPTERAYAYYLHHFVRTKHSDAYKAKLRNAFCASKAREQAIKSLAKTLVELSGEMVVVAFDRHWSYYTGVSSLFQKPDFDDLERVRSLSELIDSFDEVLSELFDRIPDTPEVMIGSQNPFGSEMSAILVRQPVSDTHHGLIGMVGPLRMNYGKNIGLIEEAKQIIEQDSSKTYDG